MTVITQEEWSSRGRVVAVKQQILATLEEHAVGISYAELLLALSEVMVVWAQELVREECKEAS